MPSAPFHLAITVDDLANARAFYAGTLGAQSVAQDRKWIVFDLFGHKLTVNLTPETTGVRDDIALRHFGVILDEATFHEVNARLLRDKAQIVSPAQIQNSGSASAQWVLFVKDPSGNGLEFNAFPGGSWQSQLA